MVIECWACDSCLGVRYLAFERMDACPISHAIERYSWRLQEGTPVSNPFPVELTYA